MGDTSTTATEFIFMLENSEEEADEEGSQVRTGKLILSSNCSEIEAIRGKFNLDIFQESHNSPANVGI